MNTYSPAHLIKYCSLDCGLNILKSGRLRWSAPCRYHDPFELDHRSPLGFDSHQLLKAAIQTATAMIFTKEPPRGNAPLLSAIRRWRDEERFASPDEAYTVIGGLMSQLVKQRQALLRDTLQAWQEYSSRLRICSFSSKPDNLCAWRTFAANHGGLALRFASGTGSSLPPPHKVQYKKSRPAITTLKEEVAAIINSTRQSPQTETLTQLQQRFQEKFTVKADEFSCEKEWRCFRLQDEPTTEEGSQLFNDIPFDPAEVSAVYAGACAEPAARQALTQLVASRYPHARLYQVQLAPDDYQLAFEKLPR